MSAASRGEACRRGIGRRHANIAEAEVEIRVEGLIGVEGAVEEVESLEPDLQLASFIDLEVLEDAQFIVEVRRGVDVGQAKGSVVTLVGRSRRH